MYTLVDFSSGIVKEINLSKDDWLNGNYTSTSVCHYITEEVKGTPVLGVTKIDKKTHSFIKLSIDEVREQRGVLLASSDWRDLPSYPGKDQEAWRTYRQALRDLPRNYQSGFPEEPNV